jgi:hypothetical protein
MGLFEFILILVFLVVVVEAGTKLLAPLSRRLADLIGEMVEERRHQRLGPPPSSAPDDALPAALEELEDRLARIEDRLEFLEELKAPVTRRGLRAGEDRDEAERG